MNSFLYIWEDTNRGMFYIGVHKGDEDDRYDRYVCSSKLMKQEFNRI